MSELEIRVLKLLSRRVDFLMYRGGAGGEFLSKLIYKYSKKYSTSHAHHLSIDSVNKTIINYPDFFNQLLSIPKNTNNILQSLLPYVSDYSLDQAEEYLINCPSPLFRCHEMNSNYFRMRSFFVFLDEEKWWNYAGMLVMIKNRVKEENIYNFTKSMYKRFYPIDHFNNNDSDILEVQNLMRVNNLTEINDAYVLLSTNKNVRTQFSIEEILNYNIADLYKKFNSTLHTDYTTYRESTTKKSFMKTINFSKYFTEGYLEDIFEIDSNNFHNELMEWHERNLELLSKNGFEFEQFKLS
jgi:hypothetical protein